MWGLLWQLSDKRIHLPMQELQVQSLGLENPLEKEWQPVSVFLLGNPMIRGV